MRKRKKFKKKNQVNWKAIKIVLTIISWLGFFYILFFVDPVIWERVFYLPFVLILSLAIFLSINIFVEKIVIPLFVSLGIMGILFLRIFGFKDFLNPILIIGLVITLIYFFTVNEESDKLKKKTLIKQSKEKNANIQKKA